jgi:uncharacterized SAM-binding protein YcdF (DUF218 family)
MTAEPHPSHIDWDGLWTFLLSLLIIVIGLALPFIFAYIHAFLIARKSTCSKHTSNLLVFGKRLIDGCADAEYRLRLDKASELINRTQIDRLLLLGGPSNDGDMSEAKAGLRYLNTQGIEKWGKIHLEERSCNTLENLRNAREMLLAEQVTRVTLITNRYHLARCSMIANSLGMQHVLCPAETDCRITPQIIGRLIPEALYILWFNTGKTWARLTRNRRMLRRVT